jgi:hypothetical protein
MGRGKSRAAHAPDNSDTTVPDSSDISTDIRYWDTSPNKLPAHMQWLLEWLPDQDPRYVTLVEQGTVIDRSVSCCYSDNHVNSIVKGTLVAGSFEEPLEISEGVAAGGADDGDAANVHAHATVPTGGGARRRR